MPAESHVVDSVPPRGRVALVGAGPGDPEYLTLRGASCLARADAVLYDYLVNPALLRHLRVDAERVCLGRHGHGRIWSQDEINARLIQLARQGKYVVRLKSGDPTVFARVAEELEALVAADVPFEIVPGVTVALAAGSCAGIPITHRELASSVALVTGREDGDKPDTSLDYAALAKFPGTLVFYMGVTTARHWTTSLMAAGKSPNTPAAIVRRCSFPDQRTIRCRLDEVVERMTVPEKLRPPVIVIVGEVAASVERYRWFEQRPLFGRRILVTRPIEQADALVRPLAELGADVQVQPAIRIAPPDDGSDLDRMLARLDDFQWLVFSSANGVTSFLDRLLASGRDLRALGRVKLAVIGPGTAEALAAYHLTADLAPAVDFRAEALADALAPDARGRRFLLIRASRGREVLAERLTASGGIVEQTVAYRSLDVDSLDPAIAAWCEHGEPDWITVTSSAIARSLHSLLGETMRRAKLVSISPITSATLRELGYEVAAEASEYTMSGVVAAILRAETTLSSFSS